jgi:hypothetical protein
MPQPPAYERTKDFAENFGNETDHSALNTELDNAGNSINDIRANLAILQADDGKLRPDVVTPDSVSPELKDELTQGIITEVQTAVSEVTSMVAVAQAKADAANASALAAAEIYDLFDDRFLGYKAADPVADNDGNALQEGAIYWNTVAKVFRVRTGAIFKTQGTEATLVPYDDPVAPAYLKTVSDIINGVPVSLFRFLNPDSHAPIMSGALSADVSGNLEEAFNALEHGGTIFAPRGNYRLDSDATNTHPNVRLAGDGRNASNFYNYGAGDGIVFSPANPGQQDNLLFGCAIKDLSISRATKILTGAALRLRKTVNFVLDNVSLGEHFECLSLEGALNGAYDKLIAYSGTVIDAYLPNSAFVRIKGYPVVDGDLYFDGFTHQFNLFRLGGAANKVVQHGFDVAAGDTLYLVNGYIASTRDNLVRVKGEASAPVFNLKLAHVFLDGVWELVGTDTGIRFENDGTANTVTIVTLDSVTLGQLNYGLYADEPNLETVQINGCNFHNIANWGLSTTGTPNMVLNAAGNTVQRCGYNDVNGGGMQLVGGKSINITGHTSKDIANGNNTAIKLAGAHGSAHITGDVYEACAIELDHSGAAFTGKLRYTKESNFVPSITFGGASAGIAYVAQTGSQTRRGNRVDFSLDITLSAKGASAGVLLINGLSHPSRNARNYPVSLQATGLANNAGETMLSAIVFVGATSVALYKLNTAGVTEFWEQLTNADLTDNTTLYISGSYEID